MAKKSRKYAKSVTKAAKSGLTKVRKPKLAAFWAKIPTTEVGRMEQLIQITEKRTVRQDGSVNEVMVDQAVRLKKELALLKSK